MQILRRPITVNDQTSVSGLWAVPDAFQAGATDAVVLAHGAGSDMHHPFMSFVHHALAARGFLSVTFNFPYTEQGRKAPDRAVKLEQTFHQVLEQVRHHDTLAPRHIFAGGKSMGGRMASHLAAQGEELAGLVFLGYPLHPAKKFDKLRRDHLPRITCPMLFLQGTRDPLCNLELLQQVLQTLQPSIQLHVIAGGDHSFKVPKRSGRQAEDIWQEIVQVICHWLHAPVHGPLASRPQHPDD